MSTTLDTAAINGPCNCSGLFDDPEVDLLRAMVATMGQWEASRLLWGPEAPTPFGDLSAWVRLELTRRLPWLRLPEEVAG